MDKYFCDSETAKILRDLNFNDRCITFFYKGKLMFPFAISEVMIKMQDAPYFLNTDFDDPDYWSAPLLSQAMEYMLMADIAIDEQRSFGNKYLLMIRNSKQILKVLTGSCRYKLQQAAIKYIIDNYDLSAIKDRFKER